METQPGAAAKALEEMSLEELRALCASQQRDIERFVWNLAGCDTVASGWMNTDQQFSQELALPALYSVVKLAKEHRAAVARAEAAVARMTETDTCNEIVKRERDAAEDRFVKARAEASELEQEMADLRSELMFTQHALKLEKEKFSALVTQPVPALQSGEFARHESNGAARAAFAIALAIFLGVGAGVVIGHFFVR